MLYNQRSYRKNPYGQYTGYTDLLNKQQGEIAGNSAYNTGMQTVSKAGPIGGVIGGVTQLGEAIGQPIRQRAEEIDPETGAYKDIGKATRMAQVGSVFNPYKNVTETFNDPRATSKEKWGAAIGMATGIPIGNLFTKDKYKRKEEERMAELEKQRQDQLQAETYNRRMSELQSSPTMSFKNGGNLPIIDSNYMSNTGQRSLKDETFTFSPEQIRKAKEGDIVERSAFKIPNTDIVAGYTVRKKGESLPSMSFLDERYKQYIIPQDGQLMQPPQDFKGYANGGSINIDPSKRGTFKTQATKMGVGVQEAASKILNAPEGKYSPSMRRKANFARNFAKAEGGYMEETRYNPKVTYFANGGTHEESPYGGVPLGKNKVEEGEVKYGNYIFTNRF